MCPKEALAYLEESDLTQDTDSLLVVFEYNRIEGSADFMSMMK
jgi:hypothetical protein